MLPAIVMLEAEIDLHEWPPLRPLRLPDQMHPGLVWSSVRLDRITPDTGTDNVLPSGRSATVARDHVVQVQVFAIKLVAAILARVLISLEDVVSRELDFFLGLTIEEHQQNDARHAHAKRDGVDAFRMGFALGKIAPLVKIEGLERAVRGIHHHLGAALEKQGERPLSRADVDCLP